ncbi:AraC family transcriptional regulator with amidase-like domain [Streptomyces sp. 2333.5]|uniref:GlxA family transcriptional regulator n=1 Tax=unclassified Streptomyces TaxID=2593676 RepID=UPI00089A65A7|nr:MULTISPECIES: helix-turn-helix domain-containing protein [unclassified Streptomyces]PJJ03322.1 AraC family transcriptional regulator with amidase-like domain [Streptomyces sp. 2333.5]SED47996.1 transcriptional regulator, AraC family with amidase-like domain [Streptomyces sp. 2314.4]SEE40679.1 transcriptional regulator, AraC family with amidase-like domain [Streptomyces sp. 2112.2]
MVNVCKDRAMGVKGSSGRVVPEGGRRHRVVVLVRDGMLPMEVGIVHRIFGEARSADGERLYELVTCALRPGEVLTDTDFTVQVAHGPEALATADTVVVPASGADYDRSEGCGAGRLSTELAQALGRIRPGTRIASICTGAFVLAAAGLLDGRRATTHWRSVDDFRRLFPSVELDADVLYTDCGEVLTAAGVASGIDLCLHMVRCDHGAAVANEVARRTVVPPHREGGQAQYIQRPVPEPQVSSTGAARAWALDHLDRPLSLRELAARESMSVRTFTRRFREEAGVSPLQWLTQQRIERARQLLEETELTVDRIAAEAGFGTAASLRQHLQSAVGVSPRTYRSTFRGSPGNGGGPNGGGG